MIMHYFSKDDDMETTDAIAEAVIRTCMTEGKKALENPTNYVSRANVMWAGSLAHNDLTGCGTTGDSHTVGGLKLLNMQDVVEIYRMAK